MSDYMDELQNFDRERGREQRAAPPPVRGSFGGRALRLGLMTYSAADTAEHKERLTDWIDGVDGRGHYRPCELTARQKVARRRVESAQLVLEMVNDDVQVCTDPEELVDLAEEYAANMNVLARALTAENLASSRARG